MNLTIDTDFIKRHIISQNKAHHHLFCKVLNNAYEFKNIFKTNNHVYSKSTFRKRLFNVIYLIANLNKAQKQKSKFFVIINTNYD